MAFRKEHKKTILKIRKYLEMRKYDSKNILKNIKNCAAISKHRRRIEYCSFINLM